MVINPRSFEFASAPNETRVSWNREGNTLSRRKRIPNEGESALLQAIPEPVLHRPFPSIAGNATHGALVHSKRVSESWFYGICGVVETM